VFCEDRELNISKRYLSPGFGFGGSCLPKDLRALNYVAKDRDLDTPLLSSVIPSNEEHIERTVNAVLDSGHRRVALLGLSFKNGSDDLRESPFVTLAEALIGKGLELKICDPDVTIGRLIGRNLAYIDARLPHVAQLMTEDWESAVGAAGVVVVAKKFVDPARLSDLVTSGQLVIDLVGVDTLTTAVRPWGSAANRAVAAGATRT
jgi:GDP-mannose 6-dehydrogenase